MVLSVYSTITHAIGSQRRLIRRVAALCLVFMGVHAAADLLDDTLYAVLDGLDLVVDESAAAFLQWLVTLGALSPEGALSAIEAQALWVDLQEKDWLAIRLAFVAELLIDVLLLDLTWGRHDDGGSDGLWVELRDSALQLAQAFKPFDLERIVVIPTLMAFIVGGALVCGLALEGLARDALQEFAAGFLWSGPVAAAVGLLGAALLTWRFLPDAIHGALLRSQARALQHVKDQQVRIALADTSRFPRLSAARAVASRVTRGWWILLIALPLALSGLVGQDVQGFMERTLPLP